MATEIPEKEITREYNKSIDKQKNNNRYDENKSKKNSRSKKDNRFDEIN